jgi:DNA topoisomerase-2
VKSHNAKVAGATYTITGIIEAVDSTTLRITELPIRRWTQDYKEFIESVTLDPKNKDKETFIEDCTMQGDSDDVYFVLKLTEENMNKVMEEGLVKKFKLTTTIGTSNMHLFDSDGKIRKYDTPEQILEEFYKLRLEFYDKRKKTLLQNIKLDLKKLENKVRFIRCVVDNEIVVNNRKRADLFLELREKNFDPFPMKKKKAEPAAVGAIEEEENEESPEAANGVDPSDYEYLISMAIGTLTLEKIQDLNAEREKLVNEVEELENTTPKSLWLRDLDTFEKDLDVLDQMDLAEEEERRMKREKNANKEGGKAGPKKQRKKAAVKLPKVESDTEGDGAEPVVAKRGAQQKKPAKKVNGAGSDDEDYVAENAKPEQQKKKQTKKVRFSKSYSFE